jgi:hypothetical protein
MRHQDFRSRSRALVSLGILFLLPGAILVEAQEKAQTSSYQLESIKAPDPGAALLDFGHHFRVRLAQEERPTAVEFPLRAELLGGADLTTLRAAFYDPSKKRYEVIGEVKVEGTKLVRVTLDRSGDYSLLALPADPTAVDAVGALCSLEARPMPASVDRICTMIYCPAFQEVGQLGTLAGGVPGIPPGPPPGGSICDRCLRVGGRTPGEIGECGLKPIPFPFDPDFPLPPKPRPFCLLKPADLLDPSEFGPYAVASADYQFVDAFSIPPNDPDLDVWATVRYPGATPGPNAPIAPGSTKFPLVVYLHGNHGTVISGGYHVCGGSGTPVPNHEGYNYTLERLASWGFIAVSINANDLNCKWDRIVERGKLIVEHLRRWKDWGDPTKPDSTFSGRFYNRVDMTRIGLAGHSRGGEAVVSAYLENKSAGLGYGIKAVHSIAPVDFHSFVLEDVPYYVLLPAADGDVWDLEGARIYDRAAPRTNPDKMPKMQSVLYGANHNWFNTVWFQDEGAPPFGPNRITDVQQRAVERVMAVSFFREFLQAFSAARGLFTGTAVVSSLAPAEIYRSYQDPAHRNVDDFEDAPPNPLANSLGGTNVSVSLSPFGEFPFTQSGGAFNNSFFQQTNGLVLGWNASTDSFALNVPAAHKDVSGYRYLSFRVAQVFDNGVMNPTGHAQDFDVGLEDELGNKIFLRVGAYDKIPFPYPHSWGPKSMLQTVRLALPCFRCTNLVGVDTRAIVRIHFRFNRKPTGLTGLDSIQFSR